METTPIQTERKIPASENKRAPRDSFKRVMDKVEKTHPDEKKKKKQECLMEGPVTSPLLKEANLAEVILTEEKNRVLIKEIMTELKPTLVSISENGLTKTTILLKTELLDEIEVEINHYDTDPSSFYLTFRGNEKTQKIMDAQKGALSTSLKGALPHFNCTILPSTLLTDFDRRKKSRKSDKNSLVKSEKKRYCADNIGV